MHCERYCSLYSMQPQCTVFIINLLLWSGKLIVLTIFLCTFKVIPLPKASVVVFAVPSRFCYICYPRQWDTLWLCCYSFFAPAICFPKVHNTRPEVNCGSKVIAGNVFFALPWKVQLEIKSSLSLVAKKQRTSKRLKHIHIWCLGFPLIYLCSYYFPSVHVNTLHPVACFCRK